MLCSLPLRGSIRANVDTRAEDLLPLLMIAAAIAGAITSEWLAGKLGNSGKSRLSVHSGTSGSRDGER